MDIVKGIQWKDVMALIVTVVAVAGFAGFVALLTILLSNSSASMDEVGWERYVYLLTGVETLTFTAIGWLFGKEVHRGQAETAQRQALAAMQQTTQARGETMAVVHDTMNQLQQSQKDTLAAMHDAMSLMAQPDSGRAIFVHIANAANTAANYTDLDHASTNSRPDAIVLITPNWSPGGTGDVYNNHPVGVWYHDGKWSIFNQDKAPMPQGAAFNVIVLT